MNKIYELLAKKSHLDKVEYGDEITLDVDLALAHDKSIVGIMSKLEEKNYDKVPYGTLLHVTIDHFLPSPDSDKRESYGDIVSFCKKNNVRVYSKGEGILHQVIVEEFGDNLKDNIIVGVDGHMATSAPLGGLPFSIKAEEMAHVLTEGKYNVTVPKVITISLEGNLKVSGKDVALYIIKTLRSENLKGNAILLKGKALKDISLSSKLTIANMLGEVGAKTCYFDYDTLAYENVDYNINLSDIEYLVTLPSSHDNVMKVSEVEDIKITQVVIGGCTNGRLEDMREVAEILKDKTIHGDVTLIVFPASREVANKMDSLGISSIIRNSGGIILNPGCGPCSGIHQGVIGSKDVVLTTTPRNSVGRMGSSDGKIYLVSPKIGAISAIKGKILEKL